MLNGTLALHEIRDTEAYCAALIKRSSIPIHPNEHEDLLAYLVATAWELSTRYRPGPRCFRDHATPLLQLRIIDWKRQRQGRTTWQFADSTHERPRPDLIPLDQLDDTQPAPTGDPATDRNPDLLRALTTPGSDEAWRPDRHRRTLPQRAA